ncbi:hypothetical protein Pla22_25460 [Rubripirellula amarantea]|uniref:Uncharacterized protein n=1 Tax=Rubripirellula amarantea TaxID=2527999 RepID=A0A5C5WYB4_9BACT|nr:hypothetical protein Pla22_25460 [Rubripirellula amarantea]
MLRGCNSSRMFHIDLLSTVRAGWCTVIDGHTAMRTRHLVERTGFGLVLIVQRHERHSGKSVDRTWKRRDIRRGAVNLQATCEPEKIQFRTSRFGPLFAPSVFGPQLSGSGSHRTPTRQLYSFVRSCDWHLRLLTTSTNRIFNDGNGNQDTVQARHS